MKTFRKLTWAFVILIALMVLINPRPPIIETTPYDSVVMIASNIESKAGSDLEKIELTAEYISDNIDYEMVDGDYCVEKETASEVLQNGFGDCVSMTKLAVAILSQMEVPTQIIGGCISDVEVSYSDDALFAIFHEDPINFTIQTSPVKDFKKGGVLHSWIRAYDGSRWRTVETTAGVVFLSNYEPLLGYHSSGIVDPENEYAICYETNQRFAQQCIAN